jgi:NADH:ubiquinone oxidoreductase subunit 6 (subunit J)
MTPLDVLFAAFAVLTAGAGALAVTSRHVVHAALWLVVALGGMGGVYLVLGAEVVALVQVLVYVGAVVVLVLFALMLTRAPTGPSVGIDASVPQRVLAAVVGAATAGLLAGALLQTGPTTVARDGVRGQAQPLAEILFAWWVLPFELLSVLLLAALVAALAVSRRPQEDA